MLQQSWWQMDVDVASQTFFWKALKSIPSIRFLPDYKHFQWDSFGDFLKRQSYLRKSGCCKVQCWPMRRLQLRQRFFRRQQRFLASQELKRVPSKATPHERLSECERSSQWQKLGPFIAISCGFWILWVEWCLVLAPLLMELMWEFVACEECVGDFGQPDPFGWFDAAWTPSRFACLQHDYGGLCISAATWSEREWPLSPKKKLLDLDLVRGSVTFIHKWGTGRSLFTFFSRWFLAANHQISLLSPQWWMPAHVHPSRNKPCTSDNFGASHAMKTAWQKCCKWFVVGAEQWRCESIGRPKSVPWAGRIFWVKVTKRTTCPFWLHRILENCYPLSFVVCLTQQPLTCSYLCYLQSYVINSIRGLTHNFQRRLNLLIDILPAWKWLSRYVVFSGQVSHLRQRRFARLSCWGFFNMGTLVNRSLWADALKLWVQ